MSPRCNTTRKLITSCNPSFECTPVRSNLMDAAAFLSAVLARPTRCQCHRCLMQGNLLSKTGQIPFAERICSRCCCFCHSPNEKLVVFPLPLTHPVVPRGMAWHDRCRDPGNSSSNRRRRSRILCIFSEHVSRPRQCLPFRIRCAQHKSCGEEELGPRK